MDTSALSPDSAARDRLAASLKQMVDEADQWLRTAQRTGNAELDSARDKFEAQLRHAKTELRHIEETVAQQARRAAHATDQAVHEHPYTAMSVAAGVGLLIGMLVARR